MKLPTHEGPRLQVEGRPAPALACDPCDEMLPRQAAKAQQHTGN